MKKFIPWLSVLFILLTALAAAAAPENFSEQLNVIADNRDLWKQEEVFGMWGYIVTDLDNNGKLEIISASVQGSGFYTYLKAFEVNDESSALTEIMQNRPPYDSAPEILIQKVPTYFDRSNSRYLYIFDDITRNGMSEYYENKRAIYLENGTWEEISLAYRTTIYTDADHYTITCTDASGAAISESQYDTAAQSAYSTLEANETCLNWAMTDVDGFNAMSKEALLEALEASASPECQQ